MNNYPQRKKVRLTKYDYSTNGFYYVTVCTHSHEEIFGKIEINDITLNVYGEIAKNSWLNLPNHHKNIQLDAFVVMPNHIHGIIVIECPVGNGPARSVNENNNLSVVIGSYKSAVTKQINQINNIAFKWQKSFYDHVIRNDKSLNDIREYIVNNPLTWGTDENNPMNYKVTVQAGLNPTG
ncbi:MAG: transposase [Candidatus Omnitrophota bacterium]